MVAKLAAKYASLTGTGSWHTKTAAAQGQKPGQTLMALMQGGLYGRSNGSWFYPGSRTEVLWTWRSLHGWRFPQPWAGRTFQDGDPTTATILMYGDRPRMDICLWGWRSANSKDKATLATSGKKIPITQRRRSPNSEGKDLSDPRVEHHKKQGWRSSSPQAQKYTQLLGWQSPSPTHTTKVEILKSQGCGPSQPWGWRPPQTPKMETLPNVFMQTFQGEVPCVDEDEDLTKT